MAEASPLPGETAASNEDLPQAAGGSSLFSKLKIVAFVVGVIVLECSLAYFYLPTSVEATPVAPNIEKPATDAVSAKDAHSAEDGEDGKVEVSLGEFCVTAFQPVSNTTLRIDLHMYGTVAAENQKDFQRLIEENRHRFRDQVIVIIRGAEITDLTDAGLGLIKRKIIDKTNRMLGKPLLQAVMFSDFSFVEQ